MAHVEEYEYEICVKNTFLDFYAVQDVPMGQRSLSCGDLPMIDVMSVGLETSLAARVEETVETAEEGPPPTPPLPEVFVQQVCNRQGCSPCVYFLSLRGCDQGCGFCHKIHLCKKPRPRKHLRDKYKQLVKQALALEEPERHRKLQSLAQEDKYLPVVIVGKLNQLASLSTSSASSSNAGQ